MGRMERRRPIKNISKEKHGGLSNEMGMVDDKEGQIVIRFGDGGQEEWQFS